MWGLPLSDEEANSVASCRMCFIYIYIIQDDDRVKTSATGTMLRARCVEKERLAPFWG
jgi:hypothetical protein